MSEPTDKELFKNDIYLAILAVVMFLICLFLSRFSLAFFPDISIFFYIMAVIFPFLAIFRVVIYITKPARFREKKYRNWKKRQMKKGINK